MIWNRLWIRNDVKPWLVIYSKLLPLSSAVQPGYPRPLCHPAPWRRSSRCLAFQGATSGRSEANSRPKAKDVGLAYLATWAGVTVPPFFWESFDCVVHFSTTIWFVGGTGGIDFEQDRTLVHNTVFESYITARSSMFAHLELCSNQYLPW